MIKKRLVHLLEDSRKYIFQNVFWQWCGLLFSHGHFTGKSGTRRGQHPAFGRNSSGLCLFHSGALFLRKEVCGSILYGKRGCKEDFKRKDIR